MEICKMNTLTHDWVVLYECIDDFEDVDLLSQLAMHQKQDDELIFVFPGWNRGIDKNKSQYDKAIELAKEHKAENSRVSYTEYLSWR